MRGLMRARWAVGVAGIALLASACGGGDDGGSNPGGASDGGPSGTITVRNGEPQNPLVGLNTNETEGGQVVDAITTGLVEYDAETAAAENAVAESIETTDNTTFTVKLKDWTFHDGTDVTANSFVDAWNYGAYGPNGQENSYFFEPIAGYAEVQGKDANGDGETTAEEAPVKAMSGLKVVDDKTFTITLASPSSTFQQAVGYTAFAPLPKAFFDDPKAYGEKPVGNGPFEFVSWEHDVQIELKAWADYPGVDKPKIENVTFKVYTDDNAAYNDLQSGNLDVLDQLPTSALADETFKSDLGDRFVEQAIGVNQTLSIPQYVPALAGNPKLGQALSMAIDRDTITKTIFNGTRNPATGWVSPVVDGYVEGQCGDFCTYDPAKAKALLAESGYSGAPLTISYNADADHKPWVDAVCNSIKTAVGLECTGKAFVDFASFLDARDAKDPAQIPGMFRTGWQMDYPSIENFLTPLYATGASSNDAKYSNPEFDALVKKAASAKGEESLGLYQEAERILAKDMAVIPLWDYELTAGYSENVKNVKFTPFSQLDLTSIELAS